MDGWMEAETLLSPLPLHRLQPFRHSVGPPSSPFVQPPSRSEGMKAAQLSPSAGSGRVAGFTSFPVPEEEAAPTLLTLICTLSAFLAPLAPSWVVLWLCQLSLVLAV